MSFKRLLDDGSESGIKQYHIYNPLTDETTITYEADVEPILESNKRLYNDGTDGYKTKAREWKHVANIPHVIAMKWLAEEGIDINNRNHWPAVIRKLNSSDWLYLRTSSGRI